MADEDSRGSGSGERDDSQDKSEEPTHRRTERARKRGQVAKSVEVNSAFILLFGLLFLYFMGAGIVINLGEAMKTVFSQVGSIEITQVSLQRILLQMMVTFASALLPIAMLLMVIGVASSVAQVGFLFSTYPMRFELNKIDPFQGIKRIFFSRRSVVEVVKGIAKILIVSIVAYFSIQSVVDESIMVVDSSVEVVMAFIGKSSLGVGIKMGLAFLALALFDYVFQWREHQRNLRMTKQEVKEEMRESEGDPMLKSRIRSIQRAMARKRMIADVPKADVVITNPTHVAVALKYEIGKMDAPKIIAKGAELLAQKIKAIAIMHNVPIVEDAPLARSLYQTVDVGETIPDKLFKAVAEILAYVYRLKNTKFGFGLN
ncbi:MAG: flagellar biosynthesis protein FlhB [Ignavibacteriales bacterium]|nr:flagellar biosynthesis protein FlhB [Ignavibacteriales bacterium]